MQVLQFCFYASGITYAILYDSRFIYIFLFWLSLYEIFRNLYYPGRTGSIRKKMQIALWSPPGEGNIHATLQMDLTNVQKYLKSERAIAKKVTLTHICIKMLAQGLANARDSLNGKLVFGKYIPFDTVDVSCLVDVEGGKDLASVLVENADKKNFEEIAEFISARAVKVKKSQDKEHQKRTGPIKFLPPYIVSIVFEIVSFLSYGLGLSLPMFAVKKNGFGAAIVTSVGSMGYKDVYAPFTPNMRSSILLAICQVQQAPIVKDNQIVIAPVVNLNFTIDHRFLDGGKAKFILKEMERVINEPEKFL